LDECKKRGRQKRGGTGVRTKDQSEAAEQAEIASDHPLESRIPESFAEVDGEDRFDDVSEMAPDSVTGFAMPSVDPVDQYENQDFFEKFYEYLRKPIDEAIDRFHKAHSNGGAVAERQRLDSLTNKFSRTMAVLSTMGEGYTQDQTAQRLGLSRNQVKYIVESVQKAYTRFATDAASTRAATVVGESHVA
jgi:DNA-directed RNA polymerase specialized sigma24 family protein